jgi:general secretion pathway protein H
LVFIGILLGLASLSVGDGGREEGLRQEAARLAALTELAGQEAILQSRELGLALGESDYRFLHWEDERWWPYVAQGFIHHRELPVPTRLEARIEDLALELPPDAPLERPAIVLGSSGELTPFEIRLSAGRDGPAYLVIGEAGGAVHVVAGVGAPGGASR